MALTAYPQNIEQNTRCWALVHLGARGLWRKTGEGPAECGRRPPPTLVTDEPDRVTCPDCTAHYWWVKGRDEALR